MNTQLKNEFTEEEKYHNDMTQIFLDPSIEPMHLFCIFQRYNAYKHHWSDSRIPVILEVCPCSLDQLDPSTGQRLCSYDYKDMEGLAQVLYEPGHEKMCLMSYANDKSADQPVHPRSLISAFVVCCLDSIISLDYIAEISRL